MQERVILKWSLYLVAVHLSLQSHRQACHPIDFPFFGFLPRSATKRINELKKISDKEETLIFYESVHQNSILIEDMISVFGGNRPAVLCKEITKIHESFIGETLSDISIFLKRTKIR